MEPDRDLYHILQIDPAAEPEVVQAAFKRLALKYHPDRNASPDAHARMQELNEAYAVISDPAQREAYDVLRREKSNTQRLAEEQVRQQAEAARREAAARKRNEQMAAQRRAANERQEQARATAAQRRIEYEEQIRAQQAAQMRAKRERRQRELAARQAAEQATAQSAAQSMPQSSADQAVTDYVAVLIDDLARDSVVTPDAQIEVEPTPEPGTKPPLSGCDRRRLALQQSQQALQNEIFKLNYGITDAAEQVNYWNNRRVPWQIDMRAGQNTAFMIGGAVTVVAMLLAAFMLTLGGAAGWAAAFSLVGIGVGGWTWRTSLSVVSVGHLVRSWTEIKRGRELQQLYLVEELAQLEGIMQVSSAPSHECGG
jgi:curved DNA-binding protein CbpA